MKQKKTKRMEGSEVTNMLIAEYSYDEDIQVQREEAKEEGIQKGLQEGMILSGKIFQMIRKNPDFTDLQIAESIDCTIENVRNVRKMFAI